MTMQYSTTVAAICDIACGLVLWSLEYSIGRHHMYKAVDMPPSATTKVVNTRQVLDKQISRIIVMAMMIHTFVMVNNDEY